MVVTADGSKVKYDYLIVAVGLKIAYEKVTLSTVHTISSVHDNYCSSGIIHTLGPVLKAGHQVSDSVLVCNYNIVLHQELMNFGQLISSCICFFLWWIDVGSIHLFLPLLASMLYT